MPRTSPPSPTASPTTERDRAKSLLVALVAECSGASRIQRTQLYKAYWLAHLIHMDQYGAILSEWPVVKMTHGPGVERGADLLAELVAAGILAEVAVKHGPFAGSAYTVANDAAARGLPADLAEEELASIRAACELVRDKTATELSKISHETSRAWKAAAMGRELAIYADLVWDDEENEDLADRLRDAERHLRDVFG